MNKKKISKQITKMPNKERNIKQESENIVNGSFLKDYPSHISDHIKVFCNNSKLIYDNYLYKMEWKQRLDGIQPQGQYLQYSDLVKVCPKLLLNYISTFVKLN